MEAIIEYCKNKLKEAVKNCDYDAVASIAGDIKILTTAFQDAKNQADEEFRAYLEEQKQIEESDADAE